MVNFNWDNKNHGPVLRDLFYADPEVMGSDIVNKTSGTRAAQSCYDSLRSSRFSVKVLNEKIRFLRDVVLSI